MFLSALLKLSPLSSLGCTCTHWFSTGEKAFTLGLPQNSLLLPNNVAAGTRAFGIIGGGSDGSTAIKSINDEPSTIDNWYDMRGRRIEKPTKTGIYIKNGKIVVINNK